MKYDGSATSDSSLNFNEPFFDEEQLIYKLQTLFPNASKNTKQISDFILNNPTAFLGMSITQVSNKLKVSPAALTRYCQTLGFSGFKEFKYKLEAALNNPHVQKPPVDEITEVKSRVAHNYEIIFSELVSKIDNDALSIASDLIVSSNKIYFFGHGGSSYMAQIAQMLFMQIGTPCYAMVDPPMASTAASLLGNGDLAIGLSSSGKSVLVVDAIKQAKKNGAKTIAITCNPTSVLATASDVKLCYYFENKDDLRYFHILKMAELAVIGLLQCCVLQKNANQLGKRLSMYKDSFFGPHYVY